ncbi:hypothetical protein FA95DRAFT_1451862, partial [Auriscalpium vulgare]
QYRYERMIKKKRNRTSPFQRGVLAQAFQRNAKPSKEERAALAEELGMPLRSIQIW